ncbi:MAG: hypothetical protein RLZZ584_691 [Pseudomonadota bacterium]
MNIVINPELQAYIDPLTAEEHEALERSLLKEGCRDALVLWGEVLVDGHNRYTICRKHGLPFQTMQHPHLRSMDDVHLWMIDQHLGRRSVSDFQRGTLALRKREILAARRARVLAGPEAAGPADAAGPAASVGAAPWDAAAEGAGAPVAAALNQAAAAAAEQALSTREAIAKAARLSGNQVVLIEKIQKNAAPAVVAAVRAGAISINAAAALASLPAQEQVAAAEAGPEELRQAARRVREARRKPREAAATGTAGATPADTEPAPGQPDPLRDLRRRVSELETENIALRRQLIELQGELQQAQQTRQQARQAQG